MGAMKRLLEERQHGGAREVVDPRDSISRYVCRRCFDGFLAKEARCCSCVKGRRRAKNMARSMALEIEVSREKRRLEAEVNASPVDVGYLFGSVPAARDYGEFRLRAP